jgi:hypothetical protein
MAFGMLMNRYLKAILHVSAKKEGREFQKDILNIFV